MVSANYLLASRDATFDSEFVQVRRLDRSILRSVDLIYRTRLHKRIYVRGRICLHMYMYFAKENNFGL